MTVRQRPQRRRSARWAVGPVLVGVLVLASVTPALAWGNRAELFGTHDWAAYQALVIAGTRGVSWADTSTVLHATDDPDSEFRDIHFHAYDVWAEPFGDAPTMVADRYSDLVRLLRAGDRVAASKYLGWLSHYYSDLYQPLHTDESPKEMSMHVPFEVKASAAMTTPDAKVAWIHDDGPTYVSDPYRSALTAATDSHRLYRALLDGYLLGGYTSPSVQGITSSSLDRAVNSLADLIVSASADAELTTGTVQTLPAAALTKPVVTGTAVRGKPITVRGVLRARHTGGTRAVTLYFSQYSGRSLIGARIWTPRMVVLAPVTDSGAADSAYRVSVTLPGKGAWRVRAVHSDVDHRWSRSVYRYVTVR